MMAISFTAQSPSALGRSTTSRGGAQLKAAASMPLTHASSRHRSITVAAALTSSSPSPRGAAGAGLQLLASVAGTNRGAIATGIQKASIASLIAQLEDSSNVQGMDSAGVEQALAGRWQLVYASVEPFRSSPFFWAYQQAIGSVDIANQIFAFTAGIPGATVGQAFQTFDPLSSQLISEVDLEVFPGIRGCVVTTSTFNLAAAPTRLAVTVDNTKVAGSNLLPQLFDAISVPVKDIMERIRGAGITTVEAEITYLDDSLRVVRTAADGAVFVYRRVLDV